MDEATEFKLTNYLSFCNSSFIAFSLGLGSFYVIHLQYLHSSVIVQNIYNSTRTIIFYLLYHSYEDYEHRIYLRILACRISFFLDANIVTAVGVFDALQSRWVFFGGE
jgi:hypothetical protein